MLIQSMTMLRILKIVMWSVAWICAIVGSYIDGVYWMTTLLVVTPLIVGVGHLTSARKDT